MDYKVFVEKNLKEAEARKQESLARIEKNKKEHEEIKNAIETDENLPESTGLLEKLESYIGKPVIIDAMFGESVKENFNYSPSNRTVTIDGGWITGLLNDTIIRIRDAKTNEVIFENKYNNLPFEMKCALLFGKKEGLRVVESSKKEIQYSIDYAEKTFENTKKALDTVPTWIERGKKLIYPERYDMWCECVCSCASDLYNGLELINALEVMEALDKGLSLNEVEKYIDDSHSGASFGKLSKIVLYFSKRGPEFYKAFSHAYKHTVEHGSKKELSDMLTWLSKIETENAEYAKNNSNPPQPNN